MVAIRRMRPPPRGQASTENVSFTLILSDDAGFQRCKGDVGPLTRVVGQDGEIDSLQADSGLSFCPVSEYLTCTQWTVLFTFPRLHDVQVSRPSLEQTNDGGGNTDVSRTGVIMEGTDRISGVAIFNSNIETEDGHKFHVGSDAAQSTILSWLPGQEICFSCKAKSCKITNVVLAHAVHAIKTR
jgi:hypothetical protein